MGFWWEISMQNGVRFKQRAVKMSELRQTLLFRTAREWDKGRETKIKLQLGERKYRSSQRDKQPTHQRESESVSSVSCWYVLTRRTPTCCNSTFPEPTAHTKNNAHERYTQTSTQSSQIPITHHDKPKCPFPQKNMWSISTPQPRSKLIQLDLWPSRSSFWNICWK